MKKKLLKFEQLPDPLSRYRCVYSDDTATIPEGHESMDPYIYFYDNRYNVEIKMQDGQLFDNYERK